MEPVVPDLNFPTGDYPVDPPRRLSLNEYEALVTMVLQLDAGTSTVHDRPDTPGKFENWKEPFRL